MNADAVLAAIDKKELVDLSLRLGNILSPTGHEAPMGEAVFDWLDDNGFHPRKMEAAPGRNNVVAVLKGTGGGKSLIFNGHMDTKYGAPGDEWGAGEVIPEY
ncbi:MAG: peptidase M20, partial [Nitrospinota bacterium]|nr:peptidase M20 [Nitrospinota bacterium]